MSINLISDDSSHSHSSSEGLPEIDFFGNGLKESQEFNNTPTSDATVAYSDNDAMFDEIFPAASSSSVATAFSNCAGSSSQNLSSLEDLKSLPSIGSGSSEDIDRQTRKKRQNNNECSNGKKKSTLAAERELKRRKLTEEKAKKKAEKELQKMYQPGECLKHMVVEVASDLSHAWYLGDLERELTSLGVRLVTETGLYRGELLTWSRSSGNKLMNAGDKLQLGEAREPCDRTLLVLEAEKAAELVASRTLAQTVLEVVGVMGHAVTLVLFGVKDYFKNANKKKNTNRQCCMTEIELEMACTDVLVSAGSDSVSVNTASELALLIVQFTKAIAEAPYKKAKRACDEEADFYMRGDNKKCVPVDKQGHGLARLWQQMVGILPLSSLETARALCAEFPTPLALYEECLSSTCVTKISDIGVARAAVPGAKHRRIGPEFARKLQILFTATDGNTIID